MATKIRQRVIRCPGRKRDVEVTYAVSGSWFSPDYDIVSCPAMYEVTQSCNRQCKTQLTSLPTHMHFDMNRYGWM